ncbi:SIR2 family NAD-dependent protein deacylase [Pseudomonas brassicacearum]|uniref:SIR2 family NAD-dependent protein deacylase n=1 Tax=Pseudomonas brassicacearum TaxID=930166 RepID=UPI0002E8F4A3|nr:SIR2 family protein [Pseudomonas brassicacearum]ROM90148.1 hypothetical protein BK656_25215 [Pseudomonas brassicacearum]RON02255.1 hypothetical protein BK657_16040 [Pseudomonas brassicacearum]
MINFPDYSALKQLAAALWQQSNAYHGAAVMVGAGFSRCGASTGETDKKLPLWNDLSVLLAKDLGAQSNDPLRLAEEYSAYFGNQALRDLIKNTINDASWTPGELHRTLLELPWSEVLTTNWDTLLERASLEVHHPVYSLVLRQEDLSQARSPRIVKLHGTVNVTNHLVFTQEDYRKYPMQHAAFVNFGRQVFIENELCLLGFSGDDPNFLQWAGWVRDHLAYNARRIYLVGALNLTAAKRKYLESINVAPVDLGPLVENYDSHDAKHLEATKIFLSVLKALKPKNAWEWSPTNLQRPTVSTHEHDKMHKDPLYASKLLEAQLEKLKKDRETYPGWLVCPSTIRRKLEGQICDPYPSKSIVSEMPKETRAALLYEIAWRYDVTYEVVPLWLAKELVSICDPDRPCVLTKRQQLEISVLLLKSTRWHEDEEFVSIKKIATSIMIANVGYWPECADELAFHEAIIARDELDYSVLEESVKKISTRSPIWKLRKASLLADLGHFVEGEALIVEAYKELLGQHRHDKKSIFIFSRLAWAHWLMRGVELTKPGTIFEEFPSVYQESKCDPWDHIEVIKSQVSEALEGQEKQQGIEPTFEPGSYKDNSTQVTFKNGLHPLLLLDGVSNSVGMPLRWNDVSLLVNPAAKLAELDEIGVDCFALAIRAASSDVSKVLDKVLSRTKIACMDQHHADFLLNSCVRAVEYWKSRLLERTKRSEDYPANRLRTFIEALSRLSVRASIQQAKQLFILGVELGKNKLCQRHMFSESLAHLTKYSLASVPTSMHYELLLVALSFPLQREMGGGKVHNWPNPIIKFPASSRSDSTAIDKRIDEIIDCIPPCADESSSALLRLLPLLDSNFLKLAERQKIINCIWGSEPNYDNLPEVGLLKHVLIRLGGQDSNSIRASIRKYLFEAEGEWIFDPLLLTSISNAAEADGVRELPNEVQAYSYFAQLTKWRPNVVESDFPWFAGGEDKRIVRSIGDALSRSIIPAMPANFLNEESFDKLLAFYTEVGSPQVVTAFVYFAVSDVCFSGRVEKIIRQGLQDKEAYKAIYSAYALLKWSDLQAEAPAVIGLSSRLIYLVGSSRMSGLSGLSDLLLIVNKVYGKGILFGGDVESLIEVVPMIFDNSGYKSVSHYSKEAVGISLVRAACIKLAKDLLEKEGAGDEELLRILTEGKNDALPEVRFAILDYK